MITKILLLLDSIIKLVNFIAGRVADQKKATQIKKVVSEIDKNVATTDLDALAKRMRKYQRE